MLLTPMKKTFFLLAVLMVGLLSFSAFKAQPKKDGPMLTFKQEEHDFGRIREGVVAEYSFSYTNTGTQPLVLSEVRPSCGCTVPDWSREPLAPGKTAAIKVKYNSAGRPGRFDKTITITYNNTDDTKVLFIKGEVIKSTDNMQNPNQSPVRIGG